MGNLFSIFHQRGVDASISVHETGVVKNYSVTGGVAAVRLFSTFIDCGRSFAIPQLMLGGSLLDFTSKTPFP